MGRYGDSIGIWHLTVSGADLHLKPVKGDNYRLLNILSDNKNDAAKKMERVGSFLLELIRREYPDDDAEEQELYVEQNIIELLKETMVAFKFTTREQLTKLEESGGDLKNLIGRS